MTLKEKIMKLQTYKMYEGEDTVYIERDDILKLIEQQPCEDCISREELIEALRTWIQYGHLPNGDYVSLDYLSNPEEYVAFVRFEDAETCINEMPSVTPKFTDEEIQKMQELEQAQLEKAYELGKAESFEEWLSSFNTDSAPQCFNAVQQLKEKLNGQMD